MKVLALFTILTGLCAGAPTELIPREGDFFSQAITETDLEDGSSSNCPKAILIFARGSVEPGNMGILVGPVLATSLAKKVSSLWVQGVGGPYTAGLFDNQLPRGTTAEAIAEGVRLYNLASTKCPSASILTSGYSQGAALIAASITDLTSSVRDKIKGAVLFGYTQNTQNNGKIPNYPIDRTLIYCAEGDNVCLNLPVINPLPHLSYGEDAANGGPEFLASKL